MNILRPTAAVVGLLLATSPARAAALDLARVKAFIDIAAGELALLVVDLDAAAGNPARREDTSRRAKVRLQKLMDDMKGMERALSPTEQRDTNAYARSKLSSAANRLGVGTLPSWQQGLGAEPVPVFDSGGVGSLRIGMKLDRAIAVATGWGDVKKKTVDMGEGMSGTIYQVVQRGKPWLRIEPGSGRVRRVTVLSPAIRNREGVGVGSTLAQLEAAYGKLTVDYSEAADVSSCAFKMSAGVTFCFDEPEPSAKSLVRIVSVFGK